MCFQCCASRTYRAAEKAVERQTWEGRDVTVRHWERSGIVGQKKTKVTQVDVCKSCHFLQNRFRQPSCAPSPPKKIISSVVRTIKTRSFCLKKGTTIFQKNNQSGSRFRIARCINGDWVIAQNLNPGKFSPWQAHRRGNHGARGCKLTRPFVLSILRQAIAFHSRQQYSLCSGTVASHLELRESRWFDVLQPDRVVPSHILRSADRRQSVVVRVDEWCAHQWKHSCRTGNDENCRIWKFHCLPRFLWLPPRLIRTKRTQFAHAILNCKNKFHLFLAALTIWIVLLATALGTISASRNLHNRLLDKILHAPMSFFDTTPLGRIMNRFSRDLDVIDSNIPMYLRGWLFSIAPLVMTIVIVTYSSPIFLALLIPLGIIYYLIQASCRQEDNKGSPIWFPTIWKFSFLIFLLLVDCLHSIRKATQKNWQHDQVTHFCAFRREHCWGFFHQSLRKTGGIHCPMRKVDWRGAAALCVAHSRQKVWTVCKSLWDETVVD